MICPRCKNSDPKYFYHFNGKTYCRKCINIGLSNQEAPLNIDAIKPIDYNLNYSLTPLQQQISKQLLLRYQNHKNTRLKAVCGAGKTEITYEVIKYALNKGQRVCFTTPRKELTIELSSRFKQDFTNIEIITVYGGHSRVSNGQFIICTTHQLYRYPKWFDLLILDELDAFPYANNEVLQGILENSIKGNYIYMSATLTDQADLLMTKRYHGHLLDLPKVILSANFLAYFLAIIQIRRYSRQNKPTLVFVPTIKLTNHVAFIFQLARLKVIPCSSKTKNITKILDLLKNNQIDAIVTTTILERGITIDNVQVIILFGHNRVFNRDTLIQICGRVGRKSNHPSGNITIYSPYKTRAIKQCLLTIKQDNA